MSKKIKFSVVVSIIIAVLKALLASDITLSDDVLFNEPDDTNNN